MSSDLELFNEDAQEQLEFMETALVDMQDKGVNEDDIGALFRAMHTIKGTAGMFGFDDVVGFTHIAENLLSDVRENKVPLTEDMLDLFLLAKDHVSNLIDSAINEVPISGEMSAVNQQLLDSLSAFLPGAKVEASPVEEEAVVEEEVSGQQSWHISMYFMSEFFTSGMDILTIISFLKDMGTITKLQPLTESIPDLQSIKPTQTYIAFQLILETQEPLSAIEEVFEFVEDDMNLSIFNINDADALLKLVDSAEDSEAFERLLIDKGFYPESAFSVAPAVEEVQESTFTEEEHPLRRSSDRAAVQDTSKSFSLRVDSSKVDHLINQISEMVIANAKIAQRADDIDDGELSEATMVMSGMLEDVRSSVMNIRMVQVGDSFAKFRRIVNDTAKKIGKDINFTINGGETELDKMVVEKISDPLMHMLRNSVDHGVEMPDEREKSGKTREGNVSLSAYPDAGMIVIEIKDDGKGLNKEAILKKAIAKNVIPADHNLSDKEINHLIFAAGLSTADKVSDISGRGVGMDVVKRNIEDLRGTVEIDSNEGHGSLFTIRLPLTLAIIDGFLIQAGQTKYIIPLEMIQECIELNSAYKEKMNGNEFINLRDSILPLLDIRRYFKEENSKSQRENVVVVQYGEYKMGILVDELFGEFQTVIKPLGEVFSNVQGISGGTILGSGEVGLIFDIPKLMEHKIRAGAR